MMDFSFTRAYLANMEFIGAPLDVSVAVRSFIKTGEWWVIDLGFFIFLLFRLLCSEAQCVEWDLNKTSNTFKETLTALFLMA